MTRLDNRWPYRYECPNGHTDVRAQQDGSFGCHSCARREGSWRCTYVVDKKTGLKVTGHE